MSADGPRWLRPTDDGCVLRLWVCPGASRPGPAGVHGDALRLRVAAPPAAGAANRAVLRLLSALLRIRPGDLSLEAGAASRGKTVRVRGLRAEEAHARLGAALSVDRPRSDH